MAVLYGADAVYLAGRRFGMRTAELSFPDAALNEAVRLAHSRGVVEETRPGQFFEISEDGGTHIMNSKDLCMIEHMQELIEAGVSSFKIEGRTKSAYYTAVVTNAYRHALDAARAGESLDPAWVKETEMLSHRPYTTGFFTASPASTIRRACSSGRRTWSPYWRNAGKTAPRC